MDDAAGPAKVFRSAWELQKQNLTLLMYEMLFIRALKPNLHSRESIFFAPFYVNS